MASKFHKFNVPISEEDIPTELNSPFKNSPTKIAELAAHQLQNYLSNQSEWTHNFGLKPGMDGKEIGKMFGVLVAKNKANKIGFLCAFSGKLAGENHHSMFVPPIYDSLEKGGFLNLGMLELAKMSAKINELKIETDPHSEEISRLKTLRKNTSIGLQRQLFDHYHFINLEGNSKTAWEIFNYSGDKLPPSGAGECAAPKLFQYAFQNELTPISIAEFWWGIPTKSDAQHHQHYYPACQDKCVPILKYMLGGLLKL